MLEAQGQLLADPEQGRVTGNPQFQEDINTDARSPGLRGSLSRLQLDYVDIVFANRNDVNSPMEGDELESIRCNAASGTRAAEC